MILKFIYCRNKLAYFKDLGCGTVFSGKFIEAFRRNILPPSSVWTKGPSVEDVTSYACMESYGLNRGSWRTNRNKENGGSTQDLICYLDKVGSLFLRDVGERTPWESEIGICFMSSILGLTAMSEMNVSIQTAEVGSGKPYNLLLTQLMKKKWNDISLLCSVYT